MKGAVTPADEHPLEESVEELATLVFHNLNDAAESLSPEERAAYRDAEDSVVEARRHAETKEGLLRIK